MRRKRKRKVPTKTNLDAKLWKIFSRFVRMRDTDENGWGECITCGRLIFWKKGDAGHFISRKWQMVKYDERNVHLQCKRCNGPGAGEQYMYGKQIDRKYGEGTADELQELSRESFPFTRLYLQEKIDHYKAAVNALLQGKNPEFDEKM